MTSAALSAAARHSGLGPSTRCAVASSGTSPVAPWHQCTSLRLQSVAVQHQRAVLALAGIAADYLLCCWVGCREIDIECALAACQ